jgi:ABC-2 type transport system ATP-binding protein
VIEVRGLTKRYGSTVAVDRLSFDVPPGAVTGFHYLLEPPTRTHSTRLTSINSPATWKEDTPARSEPVHTRAHRDQHAPGPQEKRA